MSQFGLSDTKRYISLTDTEGNTRTYWLGTQTDEGQYIQPEDETDAVYLSPAGVDGTLSMGIYDMARLPKLPQLTADNVSALTVTAADGKSLSLTASEGVWLRSGQDVTQWSGTLTEALGQLTLLVHRLSAQHRGGGAVWADGAGGDADGHLPGYCRRDGADAEGGRPAGRRVLCHGE
ncbi:MAG: DUF4340 domain-containing protein [Vescimonas sp.]